MPFKASAISKRTAAKWALRDVSFEVEPGQVVGIFGRAGSGKSTLINIIAGITKPDSGRLEVEGREILSLPPRERSVYLVGRKAGAGLLGFIRSAGASSESSGERQAIELDQAKASDAKVILLEDSFCHLDRQRKEEQVDSLREVVKQSGKYAFLASANFEDILLSCDVVAVIENGEILQFGTPENVYCAPAASSVACLTGRCNIIEARRLSSSKAAVPEFQTILGEHRLNGRSVEKSKLGALNQNVFLAIRPEHVSITFGASFPEDNLLKTTVSGIKFLGAATLVELDAGGLHLEALVTRLVGLNIGDECMLGMPPDRISVFPK